MARLIDTDVLKKCLEKERSYGGVKTDEFDKGYDLGVETAIEMLDNAPTVIPEELKPLIDKMVELLPRILDNVLPVVIENMTSERRPQGEWKATGQTMGFYYVYACNKCGIYNKDKTNFCPNCGADMRGGEDGK